MTTVMQATQNAVELDIINSALLTLGADPIAALTENTAQGRLCANFWPVSVAAVLRLHPWNFAIKRDVLTPDPDAPPYEWKSAFTFPSDLLRLLDLDEVKEYKVEGRKILCDETTLNIRYVYRNVSVDEWDALFIEAMTAYMAFKLAYPITKSNTTKNDMWGLFTEVLRTAKAIDAQEEPGETLGDFPFLNVRG